MKIFQDMEEAAKHYGEKFGNRSWDLQRLPDCEGTDVTNTCNHPNGWVAVHGDHELYEPIRWNSDEMTGVSYKPVIVIQWKVVVGNGKDYDLEHFDTKEQAVERFNEIVAKEVATTLEV